MIGGAEGLHIELTGGVLHPRLIGGIDLQLRIVGGGGNDGALPAAVLDNGHGQGRALGGVGAGAQLVKQDQGAVIALFDNIDDIAHVGREGGEILLNALLIADVCQDVAEHRQVAAVVGGDMQAALVHGGKQADGLDGDGLAAGIGAGDHQGIKAVSQLQADGHGLGLIQQRVPGPAQDNAPGLTGGALTVQFIAELGLGKDQIQPYQNLKVGRNIVPMLRAVGRQLRQDAVDLDLLLGGQLPQLVIGLDGGHGLNKQGSAGGRNIMHQAGNGPLMLCLYRHHIAVLPHGDDGLLQGLGIAGRGNNLLQGIPGPGSSGPHLAADVGQLRAGPVGDLILTADGGADLLFQKLVGMEGIEQVVDGRFAHGVIGDVAPHQPGTLKHPGNIQQLPGVEGAAQVGPGQRGAHVLYAGEAGAAPHHHHGLGGGGLLLAAAHLRRFNGRCQSTGLFLGGVPHRLRRQHFQHGGQFQGHQ